MTGAATGGSLERPEDLIDKMAGAPNIEEALAVLDRSGGPTEALLRKAWEAAGQRLQSQVTAARRLLEVCLARAELVAAPDLVPASWYLLARLSVNEGDTATALKRIQTARQCWLELGRPIDAYRTELGRMHVLDDQGRHAEAAAAGTALLGELDKAAAEANEEEGALLTWIRAAALENLGIALGLTGQHDKALDAYAEAEAIHQVQAQAADEARLRGNRGVALIALGRPAAALEALESAATLFAGLDDRLSFAMCSSNAAEAELLLGRYASVLDRYGQAREFFDEQGAWPELCRVQIRAVRAYLALNLVEDADTLAAAVCQRLETLDFTHDLAEVLGLWAVVKLRSGDHAGALQLADRSIAGSEAVGNPQLQIRGLLTRSQILLAAGDREAAARAAQGALGLVSSGGWPTEDLAANLQMGLLCLDPTERASHLERARVLADELQLSHLRYPVLLELGRFHLERGDEGSARHWLLAAVDEVEGLRWLIPNDSYRLSFFADRTSAHSELVGLLVRTEDPDDHRLAYLVAESAKARALGDILAGGPGRHDHGGTGRTAVRLELSTDRGRLDRERMPSHQDQLVEYHVAGDRLVAFVWSHGELHAVGQLPTVAEVAELVRSWEVQRRRWQLYGGLAGRHADRLRGSAERTLAALWAAVFEPVAGLLDPSNDQVLIVPHGPLHLVPFHALMGDDGPVVRHWTITLAASFGVAAAMGHRPPRPLPRRALVLSVADPSVPAVADEGAAVAAMFPDATLLSGAAATVGALAEHSRACDVLHLACHGRHRPGNPMFSTLSLADRAVTAGEVLDFELDRPLVVLSACESGRQSGQGQLDEAIGFARSFVAAGAESVVVSLWLANDEATRDLMIGLYAALAQGHPPAVALRRAQNDLADRHPHPADWAPFVIHGGPPAPVLPSKGTLR